MDSWVEHHGVRVRVPPPGSWVESSGVGTTYGVKLSVFRFQDGTVQGIGRFDSASVAYPPPVPDPGQESCNDMSYSLESYKRTTQTYEWIYDPGFTTSPVTGFAEPYPNSVADVLAGAYNMTYTVNPCALPPVLGLDEQQVAYDPEANAMYQGDGSCDSSKATAGVNVVDWGHLDGNLLGQTCAAGFITFLGIRLQPTETDVRFNSEQAWLSPDEQAIVIGTRECPRIAYDVQSVAAHEFGHVWGLDHATGYTQTMYPSTFYCDVSHRDLGHGDWLGMATKYPLPPGL